jgi:SnoaL-like domain
MDARDESSPPGRGPRTMGARIARAQGLPIMKSLLAWIVVLSGSFWRPALAATNVELSHLEIDVTRAEDVRAIKKLQRAYGYYADRGLWDDLANLFTDDAVADYPSGIFDGNASIRAMFIQNLGQGKTGLAEGRIYNHTILQPVVDLAPDGATATGRWRVLGMLGSLGRSAIWADSLYRFDYVKQNGRWKMRSLIAYAGSGGSYDEGWVPPKPRPPGYVDRSPVRFNLAHPADRPRNQPCEDDASVCVVPFPYPNRGEIKPPVQVSAVTGNAGDLIQRAQRLDDEQAVLNLQAAYGYYLDRGLWKQVADLFAPDGAREVGQAGVYVGRKQILRSLSQSSPRGLRAGELNDHLEFEPVVDVAPDGRSAQARIFELAFVGGGGEPARIVQDVHENEYVRRGEVWMIQSMHSYTILVTDYDQGWAKSALPASAVSPALAPDRPPTVRYEAYPKVYTPPLHFSDPGNPTSSPAAANATPSRAQIAAAERQVQRAMDYDEIENLQNAYGYYAEKSLWSDIAALFVDDGILEIDDARHAGRERVLAFLKSSGPEGPVKGVLNSLLQLQPVIHVDRDGHTARIRSRVLQLTRDAEGRPMWGGGIYENELVKERGTWKFKRLHFYQTMRFHYKGGWTIHTAGENELLPSRFTPPFHYRKP